MSTAESDLIRRTHDANNQSLADRCQRDQLIRSLRAENLRLRQELAPLRSRTYNTNGASAPTPQSVGFLDL
ncbi:MAG: hypothetical protein JWM36_2776 [Hyphomicrobiales bacterium]|nr:hypothetical protein [Hyphomicrobiales bacterium]